MRAWRHLAFSHQPNEKGLDFGLSQLGRVPQVVKADEGAHPVHISVFSAQAVVQQTNLLAQLVEEAGAGCIRHVLAPGHEDCIFIQYQIHRQ